MSSIQYPINDKSPILSQKLIEKSLSILAKQIQSTLIKVGPFEIVLRWNAIVMWEIVDLWVITDKDRREFCDGKCWGSDHVIDKDANIHNIDPAWIESETFLVEGTKFFLNSSRVEDMLLTGHVLRLFVI